MNRLQSGYMSMCYECRFWLHTEQINTISLYWLHTGILSIGDILFTSWIC